MNPMIIGANTNYPLELSAPSGNGNNSAGFIQPYKVGSGSMRGTQIVGFGNVKIDGANNRIVLDSTGNFGSPLNVEALLGKLSTDTGDQSFGFKITDINGMSLTLGILNDGSLGMSITDRDGFLLFKLSGAAGGTWDWYDKNNNTNTMRAGPLPDGNYGWVTVPPNNNIADAFI